MRKLPVLTLGLTFAVTAAFAQAGPSNHRLLPPLPPLPQQHAETYAPVVVVAPEAVAKHSVVDVLLVHDFRSDFPAQAGIDAAIHRGHATTGDGAVHDVAFVESCAWSEYCHVPQGRIGRREHTNESRAIA